MTGARAEPEKIERSLRAAAARGHFRYESGHHGDSWLDLDGLLREARRLRGWAAALASRAAACQPEIVCGPLTGGAFVAQFLAAEIGAGFVHADRLVAATGAVRYRAPSTAIPSFRSVAGISAVRPSTGSG